MPTESKAGSAVIIFRNRWLMRWAMLTCCLCLWLSGYLLLSDQAHAETISLSYPSQGQTGVSITPGPFQFQFDHNVSGSSILGQNASHFYLIDQDGQAIGLQVSSNFTGDTPDIDDPDGEGNRRIIFVQPSALQSGTTYRIGVTEGIRSQGGHYYPAYEVTFTTAGSRPAVIDPEPSGGGEGGNGGAGNGSNTSASIGTAANTQITTIIVQAADDTGSVNRQALAGAGSLYKVVLPLTPEPTTDESWTEQAVISGLPQVGLLPIVFLALVLPFGLLWRYLRFKHGISK